MTTLPVTHADREREREGENECMYTHTPAGGVTYTGETD